MPRPIINEDECSACGICVDACPEGVLELVGDVAEAVNDDDCTACGVVHGGVPHGRDRGDRRGLDRAPPRVRPAQDAHRACLTRRARRAPVLATAPRPAACDAHRTATPQGRRCTRRLDRRPGSTVPYAARRHPDARRCRRGGHCIKPHDGVGIDRFDQHGQPRAGALRLAVPRPDARQLRTSSPDRIPARHSALLPLPDRPLRTTRLHR